MAPKLAYSVDEAAEQLGIGRTMMFRLLRNGEIHSLKIGSRRLVRHCELERFLGASEGQAA